MISQNLSQDIRKVDLPALKNFFQNQGLKLFRAQQVHEWLWKKSATDFQQMTNLSLDTRRLLENHFTINALRVEETQISSDFTAKSIFKTFDNHLVEGVLIPAKTRITACVSSQVGCSLSCKFCATGYMNRARNLDAAEIYDQVVSLNDHAKNNYGRPLTNIVFMGMGEPLLNYKNVLKSIEYITGKQGLNFSPKRITISTAGIAKMIRALADEEVKFNLALSLHAANDLKRNKIMPINEKNSLDALKKALQYYHGKTGQQITFEYIALRDFNDTLDDAKELYQFCRDIPVKVNLIEYNPIAEAEFYKSTVETLENFRSYLERKGMNVRLRRSRGKDIDAACGQLANKSKSSMASSATGIE